MVRSDGPSPSPGVEALGLGPNMGIEPVRECSNLVLVSQPNFEIDLEVIQRRSEEGVVLHQCLRVVRML